MISFVRGQVWKVGPDHLVVDTGTSGMKVSCPPLTAIGSRVGDHVLLHTSLVVREDSWTLYGFETEEEVLLFDMVQTVSGIGPRIALGVVATLSPAELRTAIATDDTAALKKISGIGAKGASRMVLELKDKVGAPESHGSIRSLPTTTSWRLAIGSALASLGWSTREADLAMDRVAESHPEEVSISDPDISLLLKAALRSLDRS
jgi:holliday junction DNA helicase RuvA